MYQCDKNIGTFLGNKCYEPSPDVHILHDVAYYDLLNLENAFCNDQIIYASYV